MKSPWQGAVPELLIAGGLVLALAVAGYVMAGWAGLTVVAVATAAAAAVVLRDPAAGGRAGQGPDGQGEGAGPDAERLLAPPVRGAVLV